MRLFLAAFAAMLTLASAQAQTSWCGGGGCRMGEPTADMKRDATEAKERRDRFETKWGKNADNYGDQVLKRIEKNPADPDCWQYTPRHC